MSFRTSEVTKHSANRRTNDVCPPSVQPNPTMQGMDEMAELRSEAARVGPASAAAPRPAPRCRTPPAPRHFIQARPRTSYLQLGLSG